MESPFENHPILSYSLTNDESHGRMDIPFDRLMTFTWRSWLCFNSLGDCFN